MTTDTSSTKSLFVVFAPDYTDPECFSRRLSVRASHLANAAKLLEEGVLSAFHYSTSEALQICLIVTWCLLDVF